MNRLIRNEDLPESLWRQSDRVLKLPPDLIRAWLTLLDRHNLRALAEQPIAGGCIGGNNRDATNKHLAWRFTGSSARVQLAMLDPESDMPHIADAFAQIFAGGRVAVADLPCGSGAAILTILTVLAELRKQGRVPREPLDLIVIGINAVQAAAQVLRLTNRPVRCQPTIWQTAEKQGLAILQLNGVSIDMANNANAPDDELNRFALWNQAGGNLMKSEEPFIRELACLHGVGDGRRHASVLDLAFDRDEQLAFDAITQLQPSSYF